MIFVTVGTQLPFDRMVQTIDQWAGLHSYGDVFAQIGPAKYRPRNIPWAEFLDADECRRKIEQADVVVAHAGMGSIITALELGKPILVMPRLSALGEHRNDHQLATAKRFLAQGRIVVAFDELQLLEKLDYLKTVKPSERIASHASSALLSSLRAFVEGRQPEILTDVPARDALPASRTARLRSTDATNNGAYAAAVNGSGYTNGRHAEATNVDGSINRSRTYSSSHIQSHLAAIVLLAGRLRLTDLGRRSGRSRLDLPIDSHRSLLAYWRDQAVELSNAWDTGNLPMRVLLDQASPMPTLPAVQPGVTTYLERDKAEFRGTGGLLRDACADYEDDDWVLIANAAQMLYRPLRDVADALAGAGGEINVIHDSDGIPNGLILLRCGVLRAISTIGFHDMKEQVIPSLARKHSIKVIATHGLTSRPIHSLRDFTQTLRSFYAWRSENGSGVSSPGERWKSRFSICEQGAVVAPSAILHDAVILQGAVVEKGAVVVRCLVGQGARVRSGQKVFDEVVV